MKVIHQHPLPMPLPPEDGHFEPVCPHPITPPPKRPEDNYIYHHEGYPIYVSYPHDMSGGEIKPEWLRQGLIHALELESRLSGVDNLSIVVGELSNDVTEISVYTKRSICGIQAEIVDVKESAYAAKYEIQEHKKHPGVHFHGVKEYNDFLTTIRLVQNMSSDWGEKCSCDCKTLSGQIKELSGKVLTLNTKISGLDGKITALSTELTTFEGNVSKEFDSIEATLEEQAKFDETIEKRVECVKQKAGSAYDKAVTAEATAEAAQSSASTAAATAAGAKLDAEYAKTTAGEAKEIAICAAHKICAIDEKVDQLSGNVPEIVKKAVGESPVKEAIEGIAKAAVEKQIDDVKEIATDAKAAADAATKAVEKIPETVKDTIKTDDEVKESIKDVAEKAVTEQIKPVSEKADEAKKTADDAKAAAETAETSAAESADEAKASAEAANKSAADAESAKTEATAAKSAAENAKTEATQAKTAAENAQSEATEAKTDAEQAKAAAETAETSANDAKQSAEASAETAQQAANDAKEIKDNLPTSINTQIINDPSVQEHLISNTISVLNERTGDEINQITLSNNILTITSVDIANVVQQDQESKYLIMGDVTGSGANW